MNTQLALNFDEKPMKRCYSCKQILSLDCFYKKVGTEDGLRFECKKCNAQYSKRYRQEHEEELVEKRKQYCQDHKKEAAEYGKQYRQDHEERLLKQKRQYWLDNKKRLLKRNRQHWLDNREKILEKAKQYYHKNKEKITERGKQWIQKNKERHRKNQREWMNQKHREDPKFRLNQIMRTAIYQSLKEQNISKNGRRWESLVNFTLEELMAHLEGLFQDGMTWENQGEWHLDHIKPISLFDFENTEDSGFKECWSLNNLQPLWAEDNIRKSNKYSSINQ